MSPEDRAAMTSTEVGPTSAPDDAGRGLPRRARSLARTLLRGPLAPGQFDEARGIAQLPVFRTLLAGGPRITGRVLDAGSGRAGTYDAFIDAQPGVSGVVHVDIDPPAGEARPRHEHHQASLTDLPFPDRSFDSAVCFEVLEHIEDDAAAAAELARVLRPGGTLLVSVPTPPAPFDPAHVREGYALAELEALLRGAGLEVVGHGTCMHGALRGLIAAWRLQGRLVFRNPTVGYVPVAVVRLVAHLDRRVRPGRAWDLVVVARRTDD